MWICFNKAFLSIVEPSPAQNETGSLLLVRARRNGDIEAIFPGAQVSKTPGRDYLFRAFIEREVVAKTVANEVMNGIDYGNFKSSVKNDRLHTAYMAIWSVMSKLQPIPPYSTQRNSRQGDLL